MNNIRLFSHSIPSKFPRSSSLNVLRFTFCKRRRFNQNLNSLNGKTFHTKASSILFQEQQQHEQKQDHLAQFSLFQNQATITGLTKTGFVIDEMDTITTHGVIVIEDKLFLWQPKLVQSAFKIFDIISPRPDVLIIGTGKQTKVSPDIVSYLSTLGIQTEMLDTRNALSTFNVLQSEGRRVAAALSPLSTQLE